MLILETAGVQSYVSYTLQHIYLKRNYFEYLNISRLVEKVTVQTILLYMRVKYSNHKLQKRLNKLNIFHLTSN